MRDTDYMDLFDRRSERGPVPLDEQISVLRGLGIEVPEQAAAEVDPSWCGGSYEILLIEIGYRSFGPLCSSQIFSFDAEVLDEDHMYIDYFRGLQSISEGELTFTDVAQDMSRVNWDEPSGKVGVTFRLNGMECRYDADFMGDWLDCHIRDAVNRYLESLGIEKRFYATAVGQGEAVFFCTEEWARSFEEATLCYMSDRASGAY